MDNPDKELRSHFLIALYEQLMNDISRHILVVWQSVGALGAAIAALSLVEKDIVPLDYSIAIVIIIVIWLELHVQDASYWYNRNLVIVANIERQFLLETDLRSIHYYFGKHRPNNKMISHLQIQAGLGYAVGVVFFLMWITHSLWPGLSSGPLKISTVITPIISIFGLALIERAATGNREKYAEFLKNSPGIPVDSSDVDYGRGHGYGNGS